MEYYYKLKENGINMVNQDKTLTTLKKCYLCFISYF